MAGWITGKSSLVLRREGASFWWLSAQIYVQCFLVLLVNVALLYLFSPVTGWHVFFFPLDITHMVMVWYGRFFLLKGTWYLYDRLHYTFSPNFSSHCCDQHTLVISSGWLHGSMHGSSIQLKKWGHANLGYLKICFSIAHGAAVYIFFMVCSLPGLT